METTSALFSFTVVHVCIRLDRHCSIGGLLTQRAVKDSIRIFYITKFWKFFIKLRQGSPVACRSMDLGWVKAAS